MNVTPCGVRERGQAAGHGLDRADRGHGPLQRDAESHARGERGQDGRCPVRPAKARLDRQRLASVVHGECEALGPGSPNLVGPHRGLGRRAVRDDPARARGPHGGHARIVGVEDGGAVGRQRRDELFLLPRGGVRSAEGAPVIVADVGDHGDPGAEQAERPVERSGATGAYLHDAEGVPGPRGEDGADDPAELVLAGRVPVTAPLGAQNGGDELLGHGLAGASGHADEDGPIEQPAVRGGCPVLHPPLAAVEENVRSAPGGTSDSPRAGRERQRHGGVVPDACPFRSVRGEGAFSGGFAPARSRSRSAALAQARSTTAR